MPLRAIWCRMPCLRSHRRGWSWSYPWSGWSFAGLRRRRPCHERIGGMPFTRGISAWLSCRFAPESPTDGGRPVRSVIRWIFEP